MPRKQIEKPFQTKNKITFFLPNDPSEELISNFILQFVKPDSYCLYFKSKDLEPIVLNVFRKYFNNSSYKLQISNDFVNDIYTQDDQQHKIQIYHETKTSHRGATENIKSLKKNAYWPNMEKDVLN